MLWITAAQQSTYIDRHLNSDCGKLNCILCEINWIRFYLIISHLHEMSYQFNTKLIAPHLKQSLTLLKMFDIVRHTRSN